ncbi:hypothetical protein ASPZODRAFT_138254 [Penicilliopsis zonata CBS 506.65]|uniref:Uncharacterized protein n=1 Tax=Penicilliopsis zonata CBS 506.65 TaxID=1073090 RepID=A0A1L9SVK9_9EURO|nr:hypothetical protein ASPZODRAFT_138254 [Penicilliopsis zonata CBS 506.65]OJJ51141.1 hypothetical protein ASPZODRAFT_138254 [Penicilliopsis zonata CBS 506.65]
MEFKRVAPGGSDRPRMQDRWRYNDFEAPRLPRSPPMTPPGEIGSTYDMDEQLGDAPDYWLSSWPSEMSGVAFTTVMMNPPLLPELTHFAEAGSMPTMPLEWDMSELPDLPSVEALRLFSPMEDVFLPDMPPSPDFTSAELPSSTDILALLEHAFFLGTASAASTWNTTSEDCTSVIAAQSTLPARANPEVAIRATAIDSGICAIIPGSAWWERGLAPPAMSYLDSLRLAIIAVDRTEIITNLLKAKEFFDADRLNEAEALITSQLAVAQDKGYPTLIGRCHYWLGRVAYARNDIDGAHVHFLAAAPCVDDCYEGDFVASYLEATRSDITEWETAGLVCEDPTLLYPGSVTGWKQCTDILPLAGTETSGMSEMIDVAGVDRGVQVDNTDLQRYVETWKSHTPSREKRCQKSLSALRIKLRKFGPRSKRCHVHSSSKAAQRTAISEPKQKRRHGHGHNLEKQIDATSQKQHKKTVSWLL